MTKKVLSIFTLIWALSTIVVLFLILSGVFAFKGLVLNILLTFATLTGVFLLLLNSLTLLKRKKALAIFSFCLVLISAILLLIYFWLFNDYILTFFARIVYSFALFSVLLNIISSSVLKLNKYLISVQISAYAVFLLTFSILAGLVWGVNIFTSDLLSKLFCGLVLLSIIFFIVISVISKQQLRKNEI